MTEAVKKPGPRTGTVATVIDDVLIAKVAAVYISGITSARGISGTLKVNQYSIKKVLALPKFQSMIKEASEDIFENAKKIVRNDTANMSGNIVKVLRYHLDRNSLDGVKVALKILGFNEAEPVKQATQSITVVMPGGDIPETPSIVVNEEEK